MRDSHSSTYSATTISTHLIIRDTLAEFSLPLPDGYRRVRNIFEALTVDLGTDYLDFDHFASVVDVFHINHLKIDLVRLFNFMDDNGDDTIDQREFLNLIQYLSTVCLLHQEEISVTQLFRVIDLDGDGEITLPELLQMFSTMKNLDEDNYLNFSVGDVQSIYEAIDADKNGSIDFEEWVNGFFYMDLNKKLKIPKKKIVLQNEGFRVLMAAYGTSLRLANQTFNDIDLDKNGSLSMQEIIRHQESLIEERTYYSNHLVEFFGICIQISFCVGLAIKIALEELQTVSQICECLQIGAVLSGVTIMLKLVWKEDIEKGKIVNVLKSITKGRHSTETLESHFGVHVQEESSESYSERSMVDSWVLSLLGETTSA